MSPSKPVLQLIVVVLTHNEERNLPECLRSVVARVSDVHLLDSGSTDATAAIIRDFRMPAHTHPFAGVGQQLNWAIETSSHAHPWPFHLDAAERMTPELEADLRELLARSPGEASFLVASKLIPDGCWLRYSSDYTGYPARLFHQDRLRCLGSASTGIAWARRKGTPCGSTPLESRPPAAKVHRIGADPEGKAGRCRRGHPPVLRSWPLERRLGRSSPDPYQAVDKVSFCEVVRTIRLPGSIGRRRSSSDMSRPK